MSEKDLEQFNADVQENEAATAAPVDNASPEAIGEAIKEINGEADASAAPEKADDELQAYRNRKARIKESFEEG